MRHYELTIQQAILVEAGNDWVFDMRTVGSLRSTDPATVRMPHGLNRASPMPVMSLLGRLLNASGLTHRFDLRLPPSPHEVVTIHDLPSLHFEDEGRIPRWSLASAARSREIIVPSTFTAGEIARNTDATHITVIPYGLSAAFQAPTAATPERLAELGIPGSFVVHAAGGTQRKNLGALAAAWRRVAPRYPELTLVLCGPPHPARDEAFAGAPQTLMLGRRPLDEVASLMAAAIGVIVPSLYEGFGLPALEGMSCAVPVVAADAGALPEVCNGNAILVPPDAEGLADGLARLMGMSDEERVRFGAAGRTRALEFDWQVAARAHLEVYERNLI